MLEVCEIFRSIQGESTHAGRVCVFVRLSGCNLSCTWCDTVYAETERQAMTVDAVVETVRGFGTTLVELTGGEPLLQADAVELCARLCDAGYTVLVETNGSQSIAGLDERVRRIVDVKTPGSGCGTSFLMTNLPLIAPGDELKFVCGGRDDVEWSLAFVREHSLCDIATVIFSPVMGICDPADLAAWILGSGEDRIRLGLQLHKVIWGDARGV